MPGCSLAYLNGARSLANGKQTHLAYFHFITGSAIALAERAQTSVVDKPAEGDNADEPEHTEENGDAVQVPLDHRRRTQSRGDAAAEQVGQAAALALVQENEQDYHERRDDQDDRERDLHRCVFFPLDALTPEGLAGGGVLARRVARTAGQLTIPADSSELTGVEARAADESAVDVLLRHDGRDVIALDGPSVKDTHPGTGFAPRGARNMFADRGGHLLRVIRRRDLAGADRPDRLVRDHHRRDRVGGNLRERALELGDHVFDVRARLAHLKRLAHAEDRRDRYRQGRLDLRVDEGVVLVVVVAPLGVPAQHVRAAQLGQHRPGDLAGVGALLVPGNVLGAVPDLQLVAVHQGLYGAQVGERRQHGHLDVPVVLVVQAERELLHQRDGFEVVAVHLPVAGDQRQFLAVIAHVSAQGSVSVI